MFEGAEKKKESYSQRGEEHSQVGRELGYKSKDWRIVALNWTSATLMLVQSFGYALILLRCLLGAALRSITYIDLFC